MIQDYKIALSALVCSTFAATISATKHLGVQLSTFKVGLQHQLLLYHFHTSVESILDQEGEVISTTNVELYVTTTTKANEDFNR